MPRFMCAMLNHFPNHCYIQLSADYTAHSWLIPEEPGCYWHRFPKRTSVELWFPILAMKFQAALWKIKLCQTYSALTFKFVAFYHFEKYKIKIGRKIYLGIIQTNSSEMHSILTMKPQIICCQLDHWWVYIIPSAQLKIILPIEKKNTDNTDWKISWDTAFQGYLLPSGPVVLNNAPAVKGMSIHSQFMVLIDVDCVVSYGAVSLDHPLGN